MYFVYLELLITDSKLTSMTSTVFSPVLKDKSNSRPLLAD